METLKHKQKTQQFKTKEELESNYTEILLTRQNWNNAKPTQRKRNICKINNQSSSFWDCFYYEQTSSARDKLNTSKHS